MSTITATAGRDTEPFRAVLLVIVVHLLLVAVAAGIVFPHRELAAVQVVLGVAAAIIWAVGLRPGKLRRMVRIGASAAAVGAIVGLLASCAPSGGKVETHTVAAAARRVGLVEATSRNIQCSVDSESTVNGSQLVKSSCRNQVVACCVVPVISIYRDGRATATASFDGGMLPGEWYAPGKRWNVTCAWTSTSSTWSLTSCASPVQVTG